MKDLPEEFIKRMRSELPEREAEDFFKCFETNEIKALRRNPVKTDGVFLYAKEEKVPDFPGELKEKWELSPVPWEREGFYYRTEEGCITPGKHPYHAAGVYYIQEASAMAPVTALDPMPGEKILDLCASPGGKSTQIAAHMRNTGLLVSNEIHPERAAVLSENIERLGVGNAVVLSSSPQELALRFPAYFDRILVDAPCSGEGMFRRSDVAVAEWSPENVRMCAGRQAEILDQASVMLKEGGILVYSTCTFSREEDEETVRQFIGRHNNIMLTKEEKLLPHRIAGEGQYYAVLRREGERSGASGNMPCSGDRMSGFPERAADRRRGSGRKNTGKARDPERAELQYFKEFLTGIGLEIPEERLLRFGESLYLAPEGMPPLREFSGIRLLRPGLQLGVFKKGRFEPVHALAMALAPREVRSFVDLDPDGNEIRQYLRGETLSAPDGLPNGWCLVCVGGFSAGWAKCAGGRLKNHYPKGLRLKM